MQICLAKLLKCYSETQLQEDINSIKYKLAKYKLLTILQDAISIYCCPSKEIQDVLSEYMPPQEDSDPEKELESLDEMINLQSSDAQDLNKDY